MKEFLKEFLTVSDFRRTIRSGDNHSVKRARFASLDDQRERSEGFSFKFTLECCSKAFLLDMVIVGVCLVKLVLWKLELMD